MGRPYHKVLISLLAYNAKMLYFKVLNVLQI